MPLLIDGHNLIGKLPDIRLDDPDDEAKLVARLRTYCIRSKRGRDRKRARTPLRAVVVFDRGLPGGPSQELSRGGVKVIFAPTGRSADSILQARIRRAKDPRGLTVVTSDRAIIATAVARGARVIRSEVFAEQLYDPQTATAADPGTASAVPAEDEKQDTQLSTAEVEEWLQVFDERPE
jgi:predicted RNA-binding protein with PIN domain